MAHLRVSPEPPTGRTPFPHPQGADRPRPLPAHPSGRIKLKLLKDFTSSWPGFILIRGSGAYMTNQISLSLRVSAGFHPRGFPNPHFFQVPYPPPLPWTHSPVPAPPADLPGNPSAFYGAPTAAPPSLGGPGFLPMGPGVPLYGAVGFPWILFPCNLNPDGRVLLDSPPSLP